MSDLILKLYITGYSPRAERAIKNIHLICEKLYEGHYQLEIIDVLEHPQRAEQEKIMATPTLVRERPLPRRRVIGDLSNTDRVLVALELQRGPQEDTIT